MMNRVRKYCLWFIAFLAAAAVLSAGVFMYFKDKDIYTKEVGNIFSKTASEYLNGKLTYKNFTGNPLLGYTGHQLVVLDKNGSEVAKAKELTLHLSFSDLMGGEIKLDRIYLNGVSADVNAVNRVLPARKSGEPRAEIPINRITVSDAMLSTSLGSLGIETARIRLRPFYYRITGNGQWDGMSIDVSSRYDFDNITSWDGKLGMGLTLGAQELTVKGTVGEQPDLSGSVKDLDLGYLSRHVKLLAPANLSGKLTTDFKISGSLNNMSVSGNGAWSGAVSSFDVTEAKGTWQATSKDMVLNISGVSMFGASGSGIISMDFASDLKLGINMTAQNFTPEKWLKPFPQMTGIKGTVENISANIIGTTSSLNGTIQATSKQISWKEETGHNITARVTLHNSETLDMDASGTWMNAQLTCSGKIFFTPHIKLQLNGGFKNLATANLSAKYPAIKDYNLDAAAHGEYRVEGPISDISATGKVVLNKLDLSFKDKKYEIKQGTFMFAYAKDSLTIPSYSAAVVGCPISGSGKVTDLTKPGTAISFDGRVGPSDIEAISSFVDVKKFGPKGKFSGTFTIHGKTDDMNVDFSVQSPLVSIKSLPSLEAVAISGSVAKNKLEISNISMQGKKTASLKMKGSGEMDTWQMKSLTILGPFMNVTKDTFGEYGDAIPDDLTLDGNLKFETDGDTFSANADISTSNILLPGNLKIDKIYGKVGFDGKNITATNVGANLLGGSFTLNGRVTIPETEGEPLILALKGRAQDMELKGWISRKLGNQNIKGKLGGTVEINGPRGKGEIVVNGSVADPVLLGMAFNNVTFGLKGAGDSLKLTNFTATIGKSGVATVEGEVRKKESGKGWQVKFSTVGKDLNLAILGRSLPEEIRKGLSGVANFSINGLGDADGIEGKGVVTIPRIKVLGFSATDIEAPIFLSDRHVIVEEARGKAYGGTIKAQLGTEMNSGGFGAGFRITDMNLESLTKDIMKDSKIKLTGTGDFGMRIKGDAFRRSMQDGGGRIAFKNGEILGLEEAEGVSTITKGKPIKFSAINANFNVDGKSMFILPGSRASAPAGDNLYKYLMFDGSINEKEEVEISCFGNVNIRALNLVIGALQGILDSAIGSATAGITSLNTADILGNIAKGILKGATRNDFRDVAFKMTGTLSSPTIKDLKVPQSLNQYNDINMGGMTFPEDTTRKGKSEKEFRLNIEIPLGPATSNDNLGGQLQEQILNNALQILINK